MADVGGWFELFFVNVMGLPFQSGLIVFLGLVLFLLIGAIYRFRKRIVNTGLWCLLMLTIGYTTYAVILIRANANTPLNENAPDTIFTLKSYLNREQYESAPLTLWENLCVRTGVCARRRLLQGKDRKR